MTNPKLLQLCLWAVLFVLHCGYLYLYPSVDVNPGTDDSLATANNWLDEEPTGARGSDEIHKLKSVGLHSNSEHQDSNHDGTDCNASPLEWNENVDHTLIEPSDQESNPDTKDSIIPSSDWKLVINTIFGKWKKKQEELNSEAVDQLTNENLSVDDSVDGLEVQSKDESPDKEDGDEESEIDKGIDEAYYQKGKDLNEKKEAEEIAENADKEVTLGVSTETDQYSDLKSDTYSDQYSDEKNVIKGLPVAVTSDTFEPIEESTVNSEGPDYTLYKNEEPMDTSNIALIEEGNTAPIEIDRVRRDVVDSSGNNDIEDISDEHEVQDQEEEEGEPRETSDKDKDLDHIDDYSNPENTEGTGEDTGEDPIDGTTYKDSEPEGIDVESTLDPNDDKSIEHHTFEEPSTKNDDNSNYYNDETGEHLETDDIQHEDFDMVAEVLKLLIKLKLKFQPADVDEKKANEEGDIDKNEQVDEDTKEINGDVGNAVLEDLTDEELKIILDADGNIEEPSEFDTLGHKDNIVRQKIYYKEVEVDQDHMTNVTQSLSTTEYCKDIAKGVVASLNWWSVRIFLCVLCCYLLRVHTFLNNFFLKIRFQVNNWKEEQEAKIGQVPSIDIPKPKANEEVPQKQNIGKFKSKLNIESSKPNRKEDNRANKQMLNIEPYKPNIDTEKHQDKATTGKSKVKVEPKQPKAKVEVKKSDSKVKKEQPKLHMPLEQTKVICEAPKPAIDPTAMPRLGVEQHIPNPVIAESKPKPILEETRPNEIVEETILKSTSKIAESKPKPCFESMLTPMLEETKPIQVTQETIMKSTSKIAESKPEIDFVQFLLMPQIEELKPEPDIALEEQIVKSYIEPNIAKQDMEVPCQEETTEITVEPLKPELKYKPVKRKPNLKSKIPVPPKVKCDRSSPYHSSDEEEDALEEVIKPVHTSQQHSKPPWQSVPQQPSNFPRFHAVISSRAQSEERPSSSSSSHLSLRNSYTRQPQQPPRQRSARPRVRFSTSTGDGGEVDNPQALSLPSKLPQHSWKKREPRSNHSNRPSFPKTRVTYIRPKTPSWNLDRIADQISDPDELAFSEPGGAPFSDPVLKEGVTRKRRQVMKVVESKQWSISGQVVKSAQRIKYIPLKRSLST